MGMTLSVYDKSKMDFNKHTFDEMHIGRVPIKFYGYTDIRHMPSCVLLADILDEEPECLNYWFMFATNPSVELDRRHAIAFIASYAADAINMLFKEHPDFDNFELTMRVLGECADTLANIQTNPTDTFVLSWC